MLALLLALAGFAFIDSLDLLLVGVTTAIVFDSKLGRRSPVPGGLSFLAGVFAVTTTFGLLAVLGINFLTGWFDFRLTPTVRACGELAIGLALIAVACLPAGARAEPPPWATAFRRKPWLLGIVGVAIGLAQAPTAIPYLAGLAMISARDPLPPLWPAIVVAYCVLALLPPLIVLVLATRRSPRAQRVYRKVVRVLTKYSPVSVRVIFIVLGLALLVDAGVHYRHLW
ncbi:GAP family protein [Nocardia cyriacigeorgica]|uniref:GAP family protein n=1 Tax=Nocardia cyriacigeorgica TaxID=135487 RepID=UPI0018958425|nr:GAP family protein [Nocardia cyriacigeorgica]MBF6412408.1 GAP family protein [Nocardia cyriacigeorgica]